MFETDLRSLTPKNFFNNLKNLYLNSIQVDCSITIWLGFSGGLDSSVLLELARLSLADHYKLTALHINHNINKDADLWQLHCYSICKKFNVEYKTVKLDPDLSIIKQHGGLEAALRFMRLNIWKKLLKPKDLLLLGHHLNDQIETFFLRTARGSGLTGLASMRPFNIVNGVNIVRPLLYNSREQIERFAIKNKLTYINDDSNGDLKFDRNFLRHKVLPILNTRWPSFINNVGSAIRRLQESDHFINKLGSYALSTCYVYENYFNINYLSNYHSNNILSITKLLQYESFLQIIVLRNFIMSQGFYPPSEEQLYRIYDEVINAKIDRNPKLRLNNYIIYRYRKKLYIYPFNNYLQNKNIGFKNSIGDLTIYCGDHIIGVGSPKIKKIFQKLGIPPWKRRDYPLIFLRKKLIAILGLWCEGL